MNLLPAIDFADSSTNFLTFKINIFCYQDKWQYDAHLMAQVYGQHHHEWFKRMLMGYGVKKMNLTSGVSSIALLSNNNSPPLMEYGVNKLNLLNLTSGLSIITRVLPY